MSSSREIITSKSLRSKLDGASPYLVRGRVLEYDENCHGTLSPLSDSCPRPSEKSNLAGVQVKGMLLSQRAYSVFTL